MPSQFYALLVGIDRYDNPAQAPHLRGCVADVEGTYQWLINQMKFPQENVLLLTSKMDQSESADKQATRQNILNGWQTHLGKAGPGDQVFFNYSGHGAQARSIDPENASGFDETLVSCDSRTPGVFDILDKELAILIEQVEKKGAQVTVFLDCCHSGSGTRGQAGGDAEADGQAPLVRKCLTDERQRPPDQLVQGLSIGSSTTRSGRSNERTRGASGWVPLGNHVLLAGCRDEQLSHEYRSPETGQWQGATTYFFHKAMANYRPTMTWADVHDLVQTNVQRIYAAQSPQLEGPANLQIFGGMGEEAKRYSTVADIDGDRFVKLNAGVTAGLTLGSNVAVYPPESDLTGTSLATGVVDEVKVDHAWVQLDQAADIALGSRVVVTSYGLDDQTLRVKVTDDLLAQTLAGPQNKSHAEGQTAQTNDGSPSSGFLELVSTDSPQYTVTVEDGRYIIQDATGAQVVDETPAVGEEGARQIARTLEHLARYNNVMTLHNPSSFSAMQGAVVIENLSTYTERGRGNIPKDPTPLVTSERGGDPTITSGDNLYFSVRNTTDAQLYLAIFELTPDFGVNKIYPQRASYQRVAAQTELHIPGKATLNNSQLAKGRTIFKVIASTEPLNLDVLTLPDLNQGARDVGTRASGNTALGRLLNAIRHNGTRGFALDMDETDDQWTTAQVEITVLAENQPTEISGSKSSVEISNTFIPIAMSTPTGFGGTVAINGTDQATRDASRKPMPPPLLSQPGYADHFEPITLSPGTRDANNSTLMMTIEAEGQQLSAVQPETPLHLELAVDNVDDLQGVLAVASDGENYYIVGTSSSQAEAAESDVVGTRSLTAAQRKMAIDIEYLPTFDETGDTESQTRDLKRTARLYFYKVFRRELPADTGLRQANVTNVSGVGTAEYTPLSSSNISAGSKVALMIHGFTADTTSLVEKLWPHLSASQGYTHCLTYDYETFGTKIKENGRTLYEALQAVGLHEDDGIEVDVYCHSMGTQVTRAMIELWGGDAFIDRVFMGGPPNAGSPLAKLRKTVPWLGTVMLNSAAGIPAAALVSWSLNRFTDSGKGLADLEPEAAIYDELNTPGHDACTVPYYIQIGDNSGRYERWNRIFATVMSGADMALDTLFDGDHDLLVGVKSACVIQHDKWPHLQIEVLPVNHFGYFYTPESLQILDKWLNEAG